MRCLECLVRRMRTELANHGKDRPEQSEGHAQKLNLSLMKMVQFLPYLIQ